MSFFDKKILKQIKLNKTKPIVLKNFLSKKEVEQLIELEKNSKYFVNRDDGRKRGFGVIGNIPVRNSKKWHPKIYKILHSKIKKIFKNVYIPKDEFPPHFFYTKYPVRLHADTGINPKSLINKQIMIPLKSDPKNKEVRTIIFKENWYGKASFFEYDKRKKNEKNFFLPNTNKNFVRINDVKKFYNLIKNVKGNYTYKKKYTFSIDNSFKKKLLMMTKRKRYNDITNKHIKKNKKFDISFHKKYLSHQPLKDFSGLNVDINYKWKPGEALIWDRTRLHISNNYQINGVSKKLGIAIFFNKKSLKK